jgi:hypothetical protein
MNSGVIFLTAHELVHTQQNLKSTATNLLGLCLKEGSADFIAELLIGKKLKRLIYAIWNTASKFFVE